MYCDEPEPVGRIQPHHWVGYFTTPSARFERITSTFAEQAEESDGDASTVHIYVDGEKKRQRIFGFGGAFTDAAAINWRALSKNAGQKLLEAYFGKNGKNVCGNNLRLFQFIYVQVALGFLNTAKLIT